MLLTNRERIPGGRIPRTVGRRIAPWHLRSVRLRRRGCRRHRGDRAKALHQLTTCDTGMLHCSPPREDRFSIESRSITKYLSGFPVRLVNGTGAGHRPALHAYCRRLTGNVWDGEDLLQDTRKEIRALPQSTSVTCVFRPQREDRGEHSRRR